MAFNVSKDSLGSFVGSEFDGGLWHNLQDIETITWDDE